MTDEALATIATGAGDPPAWWLTENPGLTAKQQWRQWRLYLLTNLSSHAVVNDPRYGQIQTLAIGLKTLAQPNLPNPLAQQVFDAAEQIRIRAASLIADATT